MKYVILLGDGMADEPLEELGGKTPLEQARTPNMDELAGQGTLGLIDTIPEGFAPGSDVANLSVTTHGSVFWNDERMGDEQLAQRLQASAPRQPQPEDFIRGDRRVSPPARRPGDGSCAEVRGVGTGLRVRPGRRPG